MKIHEYQAKKLLADRGVAVPRGFAATTAAEAGAAFAKLGVGIAVVKAQIHAGGRGKGRFAGAEDGPGGVQLVRTKAEAEAAAQRMLGQKLRTIQTGPDGQEVRCVWVEEGSAIARELYLGIAVDRAVGAPVMMVSTEGGMEIEKVAEEHPEKILKARVHPIWGLRPHQARTLAYGLGLSHDQVTKAVPFFQALAKAFLDLDCSIAEINPLVVTKTGDLIALDAKINFDSNALFRHPDVVALRDEAEEDPKEVEASRFDLSYIALDGNIGCMVNGAGLAMATMDTIKLHGGEPANFLDVGGGATTEKVTAAFKILLSDPKVKGVLVNIFGGIMKCDTIAQGVITAAREVKIQVPLVVRLEGTNVEKGKQLLEQSDVKIIPASSLDEAAAKICAAVR
ncbi:MAG: ADP-forming succinate--CoA ligase subunit beta [Planctomycetes bacterium]|nr:ADP-forming succinate--CoA ligase subunit beta [Planctomycetota bacterium]